MAITVPRLQRIQPSDSMPSNERINIQAPNSAGDIATRTGAVLGLAETAVNLNQAYEKQKITQLSDEAENEYKIWNAEQLGKLKAYQGDPTDVYAQYETKAKEKYDEILNKRPDLSESVRAGVAYNLHKVAGSERVHTLHQRGAQVETYKNNLFESTVKLKKDGLGDNIGYVKAGDISSFNPLDSNISEINTTIAKRGLEQGTVKELPDDAKSWTHSYNEPAIGADGKAILDANGKPTFRTVKVEFSDIAKQKSAKVLSEGIRESLNAMLATATTDEAKNNYQAAYEKYKPYLDDKGIAALNKNHKDSVVNDTAAKEVQRIELMPKERQAAELEKISDPLVKQKAFQIKDSLDGRRDHMKKRQEESNHDLVAKQVLNTPMYSLSDLENNPVYKQVKDKLNPKSVEAFKDAILAPKHSDPKAETRMQNLVFGNDPDNKLEGMSPEKFMEFKAGLSKADQNKYENIYNRLNTQTSAEERATHRRAEQFLKDQLLSDKYIKKDDYGKMDRKSELKYIDARNELLNVLSTAPKNINDTQLMNYVKDYSAKKIKGEVFQPKARPVFNEPKPPKEDNAVVPSTGKSDIDKLRSALDSWRKSHNGENPVKGSAEWVNFLKKQ